LFFKVICNKKAGTKPGFISNKNILYPRYLVPCRSLSVTTIGSSAPMAAARRDNGTLILSVAVGMLAGEINEAAFSYGYDRVRFIAPVFIGDTITSKATIVAKKDHAKKPDDYGIVDEQVTVTNQRGETVIAFIHVYMVRKK
jgi:hypothetical protein